MVEKAEVDNLLVKNEQPPNIDTHKTLGLDSSEDHETAARPLALYSISHFNDLRQRKANSQLALCDLVKDRTENIFYGPVIPGCGRLDPIRFLHVMISLCESSDQDTFPKKIIGIGSGLAFLEKCFALMEGVDVKCYDRDPVNCFMPVEKAEFPRDIEKILPGDCQGHALVSGYPEGYLGPVLAEFIRRGGEMLCTTVEMTLFCDMHGGYEDNPDILYKGIKELRKKNGEFFEVRLTEYSLFGPPSYIQFYNWPSSVKQLMFDYEPLNGLCSDIEYYGPM